MMEAGPIASGVITRLATRGDVEEICQVCDTGYRFVSSALVPPQVVDRLAAEYYNPDRVSGEVDPIRFTRFWQGYVVAERDGRVIGAAGGGVVAEGVGQLYVIYLDLDQRGRGVGSLLLDHVTEQQRSLGATRQRAAVLAGNEHGLPFYRARGFVEIERRAFPADDPNSVPELLLERVL